jgi:hypothetical protein
MINVRGPRGRSGEANASCLATRSALRFAEFLQLS